MGYTVFLGAPSPSSALNDDVTSYQWRTISSTLKPASQDTSTDLFAGFPSALDAASRRMSALTENDIFVDEDEDEGDTQIVEGHLITDGRGGETKLFSLM